MEQLLALVSSLGGASAPILGFMLWREMKRSARLERILLGYLPQLEDNNRVLRGVGKVIGVIDDE